MKPILTVLRGGLLALALALAASAGALAHEPTTAPAALVTTSLGVTGAVEQPLALSVDDLKEFPPQQVSKLALIRQSGVSAGKPENYRGVRLRDIVERAKVKTADHNDVKKMVVIAGASDGYKVVFSWSELFNSPVGDGVLVYFEKNGRPLGDDEGRIALVSAKDIRTGPRHVKWLRDIEVRKIVD